MCNEKLEISSNFTHLNLHPPPPPPHPCESDLESTLWNESILLNYSVPIIGLKTRKLLLQNKTKMIF